MTANAILSHIVIPDHHQYTCQMTLLILRSDHLFDHISLFLVLPKGLPWWLSDKQSSCNSGDSRDMGLIPWRRK